MLIGLFAVRGLIRGTVGQVFGLLGLAAGLWSAGWIARWVGDFWFDARPTFVFLALKWIVAALGGLAVASLFGWIGDSIGQAVKSGPAGWLDRIGGFALGAGLGAVVAAFTLLVALLSPLPPGVRNWATESRIPGPIMQGGVTVCRVSDSVFPGSRWLRNRFEDAARRTVGAEDI